jgi:putative mRNA 3-end processing factor
MQSAAPHPETWLKSTPAGLYCEPADLFIDPTRKSDRAVITHGHSDHARAGHRSVLATAETLAFMRHRFGDEAGAELQAVRYGETVVVNSVQVSLWPAGHILGSAQILLEYRGNRAVVSGDYKRRRDPTCEAFAPQPCDVFVTEATFALPVFRHPPDRQEIARLLHSMRLFPERCHVVGVYSLGKCQRVIALLREAGFDDTIFLHGALEACCAIYRDYGVALGSLAPVAGVPRDTLKGKLVLAPPGFDDRWLRHFPEPLTAMASGWMRVRQRAKQWGVELPLVISDHADWDELNATLAEVQAPEVWVTHGREEALIRQATLDGFRARALSLTGFEEEC